MAGSTTKKIAVLTGGVAAVAGPMLTTGTADAASFEVSNLNDSGAGSLRQAIIDANAAGGADVITFQSGLTGTITLTTGQLKISDSLTISGPGASQITISGNNSSRVFYLYNSGSTIDVAISGVTVANGNGSDGGGLLSLDENLALIDVVFTANHSAQDGGAIYADGLNMMLTITNSRITGNSAVEDGGGIYTNDTGGTWTVQGTVVSGNTAGGNGGGIYLYDPDHDVVIRQSVISGNSAVGRGGGIYLYDTDGGSVLVDRSTISGNSASRGGGVYLYGPDDLTTIVNSTISGNSASSYGGGLAVYDAEVTIDHSTIARNSGLRGGGIDMQSGGLALHDTVVGDNTGEAAPDLAGAATVSFSLIENVTGASLTATNTLTGVDPMLGALANNGGPTYTHLPADGSPLLNAGDPAFAGTPATDQRGGTRAFGVIDIGSVEVLPPPAADGQPIIVDGQPIVQPEINEYGSSSGEVAALAGLVLAAGVGLTASSRRKRRPA